MKPFASVLLLLRKEARRRGLEIGREEETDVFQRIACDFDSEKLNEAT